MDLLNLARRAATLARKAVLAARLQRRWVTAAELTAAEKLEYPRSCLSALFTGKAKVFGQSFSSDNALGLFLLPDYLDLVPPVLAHAGLHGTGRVLDIGANVGQFGRFALRFGASEVVSFEPNPVCWPHLEHNGASRASARWTYVGRAVSDTESTFELHYVEGKSAQGSASTRNATEHLARTELTHHTVPCGPVDPAMFGGSNVFDLVKLDVEGFELEALAGLGAVRFDHLLVEIATGREHGFDEDAVAAVAHGMGLLVTPIWTDDPRRTKSLRNVLFAVEKAADTVDADPRESR